MTASAVNGAVGSGVGARDGSTVGTVVGNSVSERTSILTASIKAVRSPLAPEFISSRVASPAAMLKMVEKDTNDCDNAPELIVAEAVSSPEAVTLAVSSAAL